MASALPSISSRHSLAPYLPIYGNLAHSMSVSTKKRPKIRGKMIRAVASLSDSSGPFSLNRILRRDLMLMGFSSSLSLIFPTLGSGAEEELKMDILVDDINAYSYLYPTELPSKNFVFKWNLTLFIYLKGGIQKAGALFISCTIVPSPNSLFLKSKDKTTWSAKDIADSVLADKSALRVTSSQRMDESSVLDAHAATVDGEPYWYYEYLVRKSPTKTAQEPNLYRHFVASTAERDGYLYSLSASTLSKQWEKMGPILAKTVASFRLLSPTDNYVPPYKDPWRFW
ncbi:PsbP domain-containing protein 5, chloroplastic [Sesamum angolense]|uniref:PsbP domain-containing protein 5, chloroplastic n=1 Tax=Sesamum angolense TaxID=2727404 RepID=A0AAE1W8U8_9LAMI|nr:PsbP domain-containing protein 5, chloroplastic [Sesamum angolense]